MDPLELPLCRMFVDLVLSRAAGNLRAAMRPLFVLNSWRQAVNGGLMVDFQDLIQQVVEVLEI